MSGLYVQIAGYGTVGKDTFYTLLKTHLSHRIVSRVAYADKLKEELDPLFKAFGGTAFETDPVKKALIRPVLVAHGCAQRVLTGGKYWVDKLAPAVKAALARDEVVVCCDLRFDNELLFGRELGGKVVYIERIKPDGTAVGPASNEEAREDPFLRANADIFLSWPTEPTIHNLWPYVDKVARDLGLT